MRFFALATDFDGTLADHSSVRDETLEALKRLRKSGRRAILVTGRILADLERVFPHVDAFDMIVAENGGLLFDPRTREETLLGAPADERLVERLREKSVTPLDIGRVIVATWTPHDPVVLEAIRELGLDAQVIFNKGAVMVLPANVNKATGLQSALDALGLSLHNVVSVGDAENDLAFLRASEVGVAVGNALDSVKAAADITVEGARGAGVEELIDRLVDGDLADFDDRESRGIEVGKSESGLERVRPYSGGVLLAGTSGGGKSTLVTGFVERLGNAGYQYCLVDPEGDFASFPGTLTLGSAEQPPLIEQVLQPLESGQNVSVQLLAVPIGERPAFFERLAARLGALRSAAGRPHWIVMDEAHHLFPHEGEPGSLRGRHSLFFITTKPTLVASKALENVDTVLAVGPDAAATVASAWRHVGLTEGPAHIESKLRRGEALLSTRESLPSVRRIVVTRGTMEQRRHRRKYAHGDLAEEKSFYFTGPTSSLNLRAQNLALFVQIGAGVDDATWQYHLRRGEYSKWIREALGDDSLADSVALVEADATADAEQSRARIKEEIERCYTASA